MNLLVVLEIDECAFHHEYENIEHFLQIKKELRSFQMSSFCALRDQCKGS